MDNVRVRIAPSPTGFAHVGTAYTSLFNLAFAKKHNGEFVLRLEDTDQSRNVDGAEEKIYKGLSWLGLKWDEGPYRQSERKDIYDKYIDQLLESRKAYEDDGAVFLKVEKKEVSWNDLVRGEVSFPEDQMKDLVIRKSDGFPTYHFAVVIDDHLMKISHVIRAEDHVSNTPKQIPIYEALGFKIPEFAHIPLLRNTDKSKLSKRKNNIEINWYKQEGFLPEALVNFLCLLGWSHPEEKEIFSIDEFIKKFSLERIRKTGPVFDIKKLEWMNGEYIKKLSDSDFVKQVKPFVKGEISDEDLEKLSPLVKPRINKLSQFDSIAGFFYEDREPIFKDKKQISLATSALEKIDDKDWNLENINNALSSVIKENDFKTGKFYMDLRGAISGSSVTPPINESIEILGRQNALQKLHKALN